ncbi:MAG: type II toxin-antitoxin system VapC family toxin [Anaerolineae bacterium]
MKLLDSDHCVAILRGQLDLREHVTADEELAVTAISVGELMHGVHKSQRLPENLAKLDVLLSALIVLNYDELSARRFGQLKAIVERDGERIGDLDLQIASIAIQHNVPLITHNQAHFQRLANYVNLALDDWLHPGAGNSGGKSC